jgi:hypothetical protein
MGLCDQWPSGMWPTNEWPTAQWPYCPSSGGTVVSNIDLNVCTYDICCSILTTTVSWETDLKTTISMDYDLLQTVSLEAALCGPGQNCGC